jgi:hypothetical protein
MPHGMLIRITSASLFHEQLHSKQQPHACNRQIYGHSCTRKVCLTRGGKSPTSPCRQILYRVDMKDSILILSFMGTWICSRYSKKKLCYTAQNTYIIRLILYASAQNRTLLDAYRFFIWAHITYMSLELERVR